MFINFAPKTLYLMFPLLAYILEIQFSNLLIHFHKQWYNHKIYGQTHQYEHLQTNENV